jgi:HlyD family secretion protein
MRRPAANWRPSTARRYVELGAQKFISAGAVEAKQQEQASADAGRGLPRRQPGRSAAGPSAWRPSVPACASSATTCACWRPPTGVVISRDAEAGSTVVAGQAVLR